MQQQKTIIQAYKTEEYAAPAIPFESQEIVQLRVSLHALTMEISELRGQLASTRETTLDASIVLAGLVCGALLIISGALTTLWILSVFGAGMGALACVHYLSISETYDRNKNGITKGIQVRD